MRKFSTLTRGPTGRMRMATALAAVGALVMSGGLVILGGMPAAADDAQGPPDDKFVFVCKYVGKPGVDEVLKAGKQPIRVAVNAIEHNQWDGVVPGYFSDAQDRSFVLDWATDANTGQGNEYVGTKTCPGPEGPGPVTEPIGQTDVTCALGHGTRTGQVTKEYVLTDSGWQLEPQAGWTTVWNAWTYVPLTDAEFVALKCQPGQPASEVVQLQDERTTCSGVEERTGTQTTTYVWNATTRTYDKVVGEQVWGGWKVIRELATEEALALECIAGEESVAPKPTHQVKPSQAVAPKPDRKPPVVLGTEAVVPTEVHAGMATLPTTGSSSTLLLAQLMVGGGLLLLVAGGWIGLGGRVDGRHQA